MVKVTAVFDEERDADIITWLNEQRNRSEAIRNAIRVAIAPPPALDISAIRAVVEAALDEKLAGPALVSGSGLGIKPADPPAEDPELAATLDGMF
jgi:hypothetical protein